MALVAYDYDSDSGNEEENNDASSTIVLNTTNNVETSSSGNDNLETNNDTGEIGKLLSDLPKTKPQSNVSGKVVEDQLEDFIPKYQPPKPKEKVKITIPSLSQFDDIDEDEPLQKKAKTSSKGSGLLSLLPPVKGSPLSTKSFVPNTLKNKPAPQKKTTQSTTTSLIPNNVRKQAALAKKATIDRLTKSSSKSNNLESDDDDDIEMPETFDDEMWQKVCGRPAPQKIVETIVEDSPSPPTIDIAPEPEKPYEGLDNEAFKELVGKSKKPVNIKLVDINEEEILPDKDIWMTKSLTDPDSAPKPAAEEPVDPTRKKKHHITYLAQQAKANEQEFKSNWAASKFTRNQTRAKYGF